MAWPIKPIYGANVDPADVGPRQVVANPTSKAASPPIQLDRFCRNGQHPDVAFINATSEAANSAMLYRTPEHFSILGMSQSPLSGTASSRNRWRFAFHTTPYSHAIFAAVILLPPDDGHDQNTHGKLTIYSDVAEAVEVTSATFIYGPSPTGTSSASGFPYWKTVSKLIEGLDADTTYYAKFSDETYGRLHSATVLGLQSMTENFDGYLAMSNTSETPIVDVHRENLAIATRALWRRAGAKVFNWSVEADASAQTNATATPTNVLDETSTTVSAATPGFTLDMRRKARRSQSGVPVVMKVFCSTDIGTGVGRIYLKDSAGNTVLSFTDSIPVTTPGWLSVSGNLPATEDKYDLQFDNNSSGTLSLYAATCWEHET